MKKTKHLHEMMKIVFLQKASSGTPGVSGPGFENFHFGGRSLRACNWLTWEASGLLLCGQGAKCFPGGCESVRQAAPHSHPCPARRWNFLKHTLQVCWRRVFAPRVLRVLQQLQARFGSRDIIKKARVKAFCARTGLCFPSIAWFLCCYIEQH